MTLRLTLTDKQPERWPRKRIDECFHLHAGHMTQANQPLDAHAGDIELIVKPGSPMQARLITQDETLTPSSRSALLVSKGQIKPELMVLLLNQPSIQSDIGALHARVGTGLVGFRARDLREMVIAVPDPQTQEMMLDAHRRSVEHLDAYVANMAKMNETLGKLARSITLEILKGQAGVKEALGWLREVMKPWAGLASKSTECPSYTAQEVVERAQEGQRFVDAQDHQRVVQQLQERIQSLEAQASAPEPAARRPAP